jgi:hypothetical protein
MISYKWKEGFPAPKGVSAEQMDEVISKLRMSVTTEQGREAGPEDLVEASKDKKHVLYKEFWSDGDDVWARRGRIARARGLWNAVVVEFENKGKIYETRAYEFISGQGRESVFEIARNDDLLSKLLADVADQLGRLQTKIATLNALRKLE